ncbi:MAG: leucine-rich repeat domain-containing protein [Treponema sp.]|nr:leucine-rich repeat domain-containing protein [Treponema sp.]
MKKFTWLLIVFNFFIVNIIVFAQNPASDFVFDIDAQGRVSIVEYIGTSPNVVIPREIQGFPVVSVSGFGSFEGNTILQRVTIPEGVIELGWYAFTNCKNLVEVNLPSTLTTIGRFAFFGCTRLQRIILPSNVRYFDEGVFQNSGLTSITLPVGIKIIPVWMFKGTPIEQIVIPEGVTHIAGEAFADCKYLRVISLPSTIQRIGNSYLFSDVGIIGARYNNNEPLPQPFEGLSGIPERAGGNSVGGTFKNCENLTVINIPNSISQIEFVTHYEFWGHYYGEEAFVGCRNISLAVQERLRQLGYMGNFR